VAGVVVFILHPEAGAAAGPLEHWVAATRAVIAERHRRGFEAAGAERVVIVSGPADDTPFGARLRRLVEREQPAGAVVLGSGAVPLISARERRRLVEVAGSPSPRAIANSRFSADVVGIAPAGVLRRVPDGITDNGLPRWLETHEGIRVEVLRRWQLGLDVDGPLDAVLLARTRAAEAVGAPPDNATRRATAALDRITAVAGDPRSELVVAGRVSSRTLAWLERGVAARVRALIEERGMRSIASETDRADQRPPRSIVGSVLDKDGPAALGSLLVELGEAAVVDSRVLIAHRFGGDERGWPRSEDRFASDLLLHERIDDPWLRDLTRSAAQAAIPVVLGGHTLVGPGLRLALRPAGRRR
jgi:hypothetical protein